VNVGDPDTVPAIGCDRSTLVPVVDTTVVGRTLVVLAEPGNAIQVLESASVTTIPATMLPGTLAKFNIVPDPPVAVNVTAPTDVVWKMSEYVPPQSGIAGVPPG
jgi:hypothetical protein